MHKARTLYWLIAIGIVGSVLAWIIRDTIRPPSAALPQHEQMAAVHSSSGLERAGSVGSEPRSRPNQSAYGQGGEVEPPSPSMTLKP